MSDTLNSTASPSIAPAAPAIRRIDPEAPWHWLAAGWRDLWQAPRISLFYGALFSLVSALITVGLWAWGKPQYLPPLAGGFMLVGPLLAVGLYEVSRRLERGQRPTLARALFVKVAAPTQLALLGLLLTAVLLSWMYAAVVLFAIVMGPVELPPPAMMPALLLSSAEGLALLAIGSAVGGGLAAAIFAISAVSAPLLLERQCDVVTAALTSLRAVRANWKPMLLWAALIVAITAAGIVTLYVGLIVAFPLIGHASWHAYRDLVEPPG